MNTTAKSLFVGINLFWIAVCTSALGRTDTFTGGENGTNKIPALYSTAPSSYQALASRDLQLRGALEETISAHIVRVDPDVLRWLPNPQLRLIYVDSYIPFSGGKFRVSLEPGLQPLVQVNRIEQYMPGVKTYVGHLVGVPDSFVTLSFSHDGFHGWVDTVVERYEIEQVLTSAGRSANLAIVRKIDYLQMQIDDALGDTSLLTTKQRGVKKITAGAGSEKLSMLPKDHGGGTHVFSQWVLWTASTSYERNMSTFVSNLMSTMNDSFSNSNADAFTVLNHADVIDYTESGYAPTDLDRITNGSDGHMDDVPPALDGWGADTVALIIDDDLVTSGPAGAAEIWAPGVGPPEDYPYAVISDDFALGTYLFSHEVGHVLGGFHQAGTNPGYNNWADCEHAYASQESGWITIMGTCTAPSGSDCTTRINYWSNADPNVTYQGEQMGDSDAEQCSDIARVMLPDTLSDVMNWRSNPTSVPGAPMNVDVEPLQCYGQNAVTWSSGGGGALAEYQVFKSTSATFSPQTLVYRSSDPGFGLNISQSESPSYIRVRACNLAGCSTYSQGDETATYTSGCL